MKLSQDKIKKLLSKIKSNKKMIGPDPGPFKLDICFDTGLIEKGVECFGTIINSKYQEGAKNAVFRDAINDRYFTRFNVQKEKHEKLRLTISDQNRKEAILVIVTRQEKKNPEPGDKNNNFRITDYSLLKDYTIEDLIAEIGEEND